MYSLTTRRDSANPSEETFAWQHDRQHEGRSGQLGQADECLITIGHFKQEPRVKLLELSNKAPKISWPVETFSSRVEKKVWVGSRLMR